MSSLRLPSLLLPRRIALACAMLASGAFFVSQMSAHYDVRTWLVWRWLGCVLAVTTFAGATYAIGDRLVRKIVGRPLAFTHHVPIAWVTGTLAFGVGTFVAGLLHLLYLPLFFVLPVACLAIGGRAPWRFLRRGASRLFGQLRITWSGLAAFALLAVGVLAIYVPILTPTSIGYDAQWYHLPLAEHYVAAHRIGRFPEGWHPGTSPHFASFLYTWAFLGPGRYFDHAELVLHIELVSVLQVLVAAPSALRATLRRGFHPLAGAALFLFPTIFLCDLNGGADHVSAAFVLPAWTAACLAFGRGRPWAGILFGLSTGGLVLSKLSNAPYFLALWVVFFVPVLVSAVRSEPLDRRTLAFAFGALLLASAPWWLRNAIAHRNPVYPSAYGIFTGSKPWNPDVVTIHEKWLEVELWHPPRTLAGQLESLKMISLFSFRTHDWASYAGKTPVFGSLFTLGMFVLPFAAANRRTWALYLLGAISIFGWYSFHHQERYLQTPLPLFAVAAGAVFVQIARQGAVFRVLASGLVALQLAWGADIYAFPSHQHWVRPLLDLATAGFRGAREGSLVVSGFEILGETLPRDARVVVHETHVHFGLMRETINDWPAWQGGLNYGRKGFGGSWRQLKAYGATHLLWEGDSKNGDSLSGDLVFYAIAQRAGVEARLGSFHYVALPATPPPDPAPMVAVIGCAAFAYPVPGIYRLEDWAYPALGPDLRPNPREPLPALLDPAVVGYVVQATACGPARELGNGYVVTGRRGNHALLVAK